MQKTNSERFSGMMGFARRAGKTVSGTELVLRAVQKGTAKLVVVSESASDATRKKLRTNCEFYGAPRIEASVDTEELGRLIGKSSAISAVAITDEIFAREIKRAICPEE